jgi:hypothetical protein
MLDAEVARLTRERDRLREALTVAVEALKQVRVNEEIEDLASAIARKALKRIARAALEVGKP